MDWTQDAMEELRRLWAQRELSTAEIGRRMGGLTKNVIVGKAHRMGLPNRPSPIQRADAEIRRAQMVQAVALKAQGFSDREVGQRMGVGLHTAGRLLRAAGHGGRGGRRRALAVGAALPVAAAAERPVERPAPVPVQPLAGPVIVRPLNRLGPGCRWPIGEPGTPGFRFCGAADVEPGKPYCAEHCARAYARPLVHGLALAPRGWVR